MTTFTLLQGALPLPSWTDEELSKLKRGEILPGAALLVEQEDDLPQQAPVAEEEEELPELPPEPEYDPKSISSEHLMVYFQETPKSFLVDPQRLLTMQETLDLEGFLEYHADASEMDIRLYLFDALQQIPPSHSLQNLVRHRYASGPPTAVVFYFLGDPSRTMLAFGGKGTARIDTKEIRQILASAQLKSMEEPEPADQVEAFIVQLSIKLFWLEKSLREAQIAAQAQESRKETASAGTPKDTSGSKRGGLLSRFGDGFFYLCIGASGLVLSLCAIVIGWGICARNRKYRLPVIELPGRLGADYGAGVGAVLGFSDAFGSPAAQRDQVPDY